MEKITLHGGPQHGRVHDIPPDYGDELAFEALVIHKGQKGRRPCRYTRVRNVVGGGSHDFEWMGFTGEMVLLSED